MISTVHFVSASAQDTATLFIYNKHDLLRSYTYFLTLFAQQHLAGEKQEDEILNRLKIYSSRNQEKKSDLFYSHLSKCQIVTGKQNKTVTLQRNSARNSIKYSTGEVK